MSKNKTFPPFVFVRKKLTEYEDKNIMEKNITLKIKSNLKLNLDQATVLKNFLNKEYEIKFVGFCKLSCRGKY